MLAAPRTGDGTECAADPSWCGVPQSPEPGPYSAAMSLDVAHRL